MQKLEKAGEPTMEEILASIRQIISEEPAPRPSPPLPPMPAQLSPQAPAMTQPPAPQSLSLPTQQPAPTAPPMHPTAPAAAAPPTLAPVQAPKPVAPAAPTAPPVMSPPMLPPAATSPPVGLSVLQPPAPTAPPGPLPAPGPVAAPPADYARDAALQLQPRPQPPAATGGESIALSDGLTGPPRRPSFGIQPSMIGVAPNAEQYSRSMWRFGKRASDVAPAAPADPGVMARETGPEFAPSLSMPPATSAPTAPPQPTSPPPNGGSLRLEPTLPPVSQAADLAPADPVAFVPSRPRAPEPNALSASGRMPSIVGPVATGEPQQFPPFELEPAPMQAPSAPQAPAPSASMPPLMDARSTMSALAASLAGSAVQSRPGPARDLPVERPAPPAAPPPPAESAPTAPPAPVVLAPAAAGPALPVPVRSIEDVVVELLRPMLRQWLDDNMPRIVEKTLRVELAEQLKKPKP